MNEFKACFFSNPNELHWHRLAVTQKQLTQFWFSKSLVELERILCIKDQYLIYNIVFEQYLKYYLTNKKIALGEVFHVVYKQQTIAYVYDAKIFRNPGFDKYDNDLISTFVIGFREKDEWPEDDVFEFLDYDVMEPQQWVLKVKQSAILRIFSFLMHRFLQKKQSSWDCGQRNRISVHHMSRDPNCQRQVVILQPSIYYYYMYALTPKYQINYQSSVRGVFEVVAELMLNNLLIAWYNQLSHEQKYERHFKRYFRLIEKPKNKQQFTSVDIRFTEIKEQSFKIPVFKLKYRVHETEHHYQCFQINIQSELLLNQPYTDLTLEDENILKAFNKQRISSPNYDLDYTVFYQTINF